MKDLANIKNFHQITPEIGTAGMPKAEQIKDIADAGYELVINLALPDQPGATVDEDQLVAAAGMTYKNIPVEFDRPTLADFETFAETLKANRQRRVFVHCAMNYRVSAFMYLYRLVEGEATREDAMSDLVKLWQPEPVWQDLIDEVLEHYGVSPGES